MNENDFMRQQQAAVERMREMSSRAVPGGTNQPMPPVPPFVRLQNSGQNRAGNYRNTVPAARQNGAKQPSEPEKVKKNDNLQNRNPSENVQNGNSLFAGLNLPFLDMFSKDSDAALIVGLLLILMSEKADKKLLFALIYILL